MVITKDVFRYFCNECGDYCPLGAIHHGNEQWLCQGCDIELTALEEQALTAFNALHSMAEVNAQAFVAKPEAEIAAEEEDDGPSDLENESNLALADAGDEYPFTDPEEEAAYLAHMAQMERQCDATYVTGPAHDPYSTCCHLDKGHDGPHKGGDPFGGDQPVYWTGGGSCAGDALPFTIL